MDTKRLRQRVLDLAIHGKLVPQNPQDEPASELLKRIAAEKERLIKEGKIKKSKKKDNEDIEKVPFEVPQGWVWCRLKNLCSKFSTGPFGSMVHKNDYVQINGTPLINPANIIEGKIESDKIMMVSEEKSNELAKYKLDVNDIILARRGDLSKCAIISDIEKNWLCGTGAFFLHLIYIYPHYFKTFYLSVYLQNILSSKSVGATMDNLNQSILGDVLFPLPPLAEQHRIVSEVEKYFSLIDILEESENDLQQSIQKAKSKILDLAIKGKLVEQNEEDEPASILLERIKEEKNKNEKKGKIKDTEKINEVPFEVPQGWVWCRIDDIAYVTKLAGFEYSKYISNNIIKNEGIPLFKGKNVQDGKVIYEFDAYIPEEISDILFRSQITKKCLLTPYVGTLGNIGIHDKKGKFHLGSNVGKIELYNDIEMKISEEYIRFYIMSPIGKKQLTKHKKATAQESISIESIRDIYVPLPPLAEQHRIVAKIEELFTQLDNIAEALK